MRPGLLWKLISTIKNVSKKDFYKCYVFGLADGLLTSAILVAMSWFFDTLTAYINGTTTIAMTVAACVLFFAVKIAGEVVNGYSNYCGEKFYYLSVRHISGILNQKCADISAEKFESTEFLNRVSKTYAGVGEARNFVNTILSVLFLYVPYILVTSVYLMLKAPAFIAIVIIVIVVMMAGQWIRGKISIDMENKVAAMSRRADEYEDKFLNKNNIKDTRTLRAEPFFLKLFQTALYNVYSIKKEAARQKNRLEMLIETIHAVGYMVSVGLMLGMLVRGKISVGVFAVLFYALDNLFLMVEECIGECQEYGADSIGRIKNLMEFLEEETTGKRTDTKTDKAGIIAEHVCFSYPEGKEVLHHLSFTIREGETIAVVGRNGSGKSTLLRLMLGLYQPSEGIVLKSEKLCNSSAVFQKYGKYPMTVGENIRISSPDVKKEKDLEEVLQKKGFAYPIHSFSEGEDTFLGKEYGGEELSGGQWQKLAIARGAYRDSALICLDEPTSAIDPAEENMLYEQFQKMCHNKTAMIVTHRMGLVKLADRIMVMEDGNMVGFDTHSRLLETCEEYKKLWHSQASVYTNA